MGSIPKTSGVRRLPIQHRDIVKLQTQRNLSFRELSFVTPQTGNHSEYLFAKRTNNVGEPVANASHLDDHERYTNVVRELLNTYLAKTEVLNDVRSKYNNLKYKWGKYSLISAALATAVTTVATLLWESSLAVYLAIPLIAGQAISFLGTGLAILGLIAIPNLIKRFVTKKEIKARKKEREPYARDIRKLYKDPDKLHNILDQNGAQTKREVLASELHSYLKSNKTKECEEIFALFSPEQQRDLKAFMMSLPARSTAKSHFV